MENIIMPELMTPAFTEVLASRPEVLEQLLGMQMNEETMVNRSLELNTNNMPRVLKLLFCNVSIRINNSEDIEFEASGSEGSKENTMAFPLDKVGIKRSIEELKRLEAQLAIKNSQLGILTNEVAAMTEKVAILETRLKEASKLIKLVSKEPYYRKLSYRYKMDIKGLTNSYRFEKSALEEKKQLLSYEKGKKSELEENIRNITWKLLVKLL